MSTKGGNSGGEIDKTKGGTIQLRAYFLLKILKMRKLTLAPRAGKRYLDLLQKAIGHKLSDDFIEIIVSYGGLAILESKYIDSRNIVWEIQTFDHIASMVDLIKEFKENGWGLKVPFAYDPGGWHFCLSFDKDTFGKIIVNRWTDHSPDEQFIVIANSFEEFINGLC